MNHDELSKLKPNQKISLAIACEYLEWKHGIIRNVVALRQLLQPEFIKNWGVVLKAEKQPALGKGWFTTRKALDKYASTRKHGA